MTPTVSRLFLLSPLAALAMTGFGTHAADFFLFTQCILGRLSLFLLLVVVVNIHRKAHQNHEQDRPALDVQALIENIPYAEYEGNSK